MCYGKVRFPLRSGTFAEAWLDRQGRWRCETIPSLTRVLDIRHGPGWAGEPADPDTLSRHLKSAAAWLKGEAFLLVLDNDPDDEEPAETAFQPNVAPGRSSDRASSSARDDRSSALTPPAP